MSEENGIDERKLRYLYEMAMSGGIRAAADRLGINASVISRQIALMEKSLGVSLIEKSGRGVVLTEVGHDLVEFYRDNLSRNHALMNRLDSYRSLKHGKLSIAVGEGFLARLMGRALTTFCEQYPEILVELKCGSTAEIMSMVSEGTVDMGLCTGVSEYDPAFKIRSFFGSSYCAVMSVTNPLATRTEIKVEDLADQRLIFLSDHFGVQRFLNMLLRDARMNLVPSYRCDRFLAACTVAENGLGIAFMTIAGMRSVTRSNKLVGVPIVHQGVETRVPIQLIAKVGKSLSPAAAYLWRQLEYALGQTRQAIDPMTD